MTIEIWKKMKKRKWGVYIGDLKSVTINKNLEKSKAIKQLTPVIPYKLLIYNLFSK